MHPLLPQGLLGDSGWVVAALTAGRDLPVFVILGSVRQGIQDVSVSTSAPSRDLSKCLAHAECKTSKELPDVSVKV